MVAEKRRDVYYISKNLYLMAESFRFAQHCKEGKHALNSHLSHYSPSFPLSFHHGSLVIAALFLKLLLVSGL